MRTVLIILAALQIAVGYLLMRWGVRDGIIQKRIRTSMFSQKIVAGSEAVNRGVFGLVLGLVLMSLGCLILNRVFLR